MDLAPRDRVRVLAIGRMMFGVALLLWPRKVMASWVGRYAQLPAVRAVGRSVGIRDIVLGGIALHTVDHPEIGPRWQATCGVVDSVDLLATIAARSDLPPRGFFGTTLVAGGSAAGSFHLSRTLRR